MKLESDCYLEPLCPLHVTHDVITLAGSKKPSWACDYDYPRGVKLTPSYSCSTDLFFVIRHFVAK